MSREGSGGGGKMQDDAMLLERIDALRGELEAAREREAALERQNTGLRRQLNEAKSSRGSRAPPVHPPMVRARRLREAERECCVWGRRPL